MYKYFEKNYMWSLAVMRMIGSGALLGEINRVATTLVDDQETGPNGDPEAWYTGWHALAEQLRSQAQEAAADGHTESAYAYFKRAALYFFWAEAFLPPEDKRKLKSLNEMLSTFSLAAEHSSGRLELVEVPYEDTTLPAYFLRAPGEGPAPCVVVFGGLDSAKEELIGTAGYFVARGISALVVEGPGQGVALKVQGLNTRFDYEVPAGAAYDYAASRDDVDESRIALCGISMGGYYASRAAAFEKRFKACVIVGAQYDYRATWVRRMDIKPGAPTPAPSSHLFDVLGVSNWDEALEALTPFTLAGVAEKIECPILVTHGELDRQILVEDAHSLFAEIGSEDKTLRIFTDEEGGSGHSHVDSKEPAYPFLSDWLAGKLQVSS